MQNSAKRNKIPLGGALVFLIFIAGFLVLGVEKVASFHLLSALTLIYLVGLLDDYKDLSFKTKLLLQVLAVAYLVYFGIRVNYITNPFEGFIYFEELSFPVTLVWFVLMINLLNLLDALKGLASGIAIISSLFILIIAWDLGRYLTVVSAALLLLGLIIIKYLARNHQNWELGNSGSMFVGAVLGLISIIGAVKSITFISLVLPAMLLGIPIINGLIVFYQLIFKKDFDLTQLRSRLLHHILLDSGLNEEQSRQILYLISFSFGLTAFLLTKIATTQSFMIIILVFFALLIYFRELKNSGQRKNNLVNVKLLKDVQLSLYQIRDKLQYKLANGELTVVKEEISDLEEILSRRLPLYFTEIEEIEYQLKADEQIEDRLNDILKLLEKVFDVYNSELDNLDYVLRDYKDELKETVEKLDEIYYKLK